MAANYNPEYNPTGVEGAIDTNILPWLALQHLPGIALKPLRASIETGFFSVILKLEAEARLPSAICLGGLDLMVLSGALSYVQDGQQSLLEAGVWGYVSANSRIDAISAEAESELLVNFHNAAVFLDEAGAVDAVLTSLDVAAMARAAGIELVANTLAEAEKNSQGQFNGEGEPLAIARKDARKLVVASAEAAGRTARLSHPHFVDTREVPWAFAPGMPDVGLKLLRVSEETGAISLIVRHNGVAPPHNHIGAGDFLILHGRMGYRAGPPEGCGPGVWVYEPAGARHDETQRLGDDDLIYTANLYGPVMFDTGRGTPISAMLSWMEYKALAEAAGARLVQSSQPTDRSTMLAWAPPINQTIAAH